jgi:hypothetical protein
MLFSCFGSAIMDGDHGGLWISLAQRVDSIELGFVVSMGTRKKEEKLQKACKRRWTVACFSYALCRLILIPRERSHLCDLAK